MLAEFLWISLNSQIFPEFLDFLEFLDFRHKYCDYCYSGHHILIFREFLEFLGIPNSWIVGIADWARLWLKWSWLTCYGSYTPPPGYFFSFWILYCWGSCEDIRSLNHFLDIFCFSEEINVLWSSFPSPKIDFVLFFSQYFAYSYSNDYQNLTEPTTRDS